MLNNADETAFDRLTAFAAEANDYTIRAAQFRPDVAALLITIEQLEAEIASLREGLATRDKAVATCPIQRRYQDACPKCKATSSEDCGVVSAADYQFVEAARALLKGQGK